MEEEKLKSIIRFTISEARRRKGYSRYELSKRTGIHTSQIIRIERGENIPRADTIMKIFDALSIQFKIILPDLLFK